MIRSGTLSFRHRAQPCGRPHELRSGSKAPCDCPIVTRPVLHTTPKYAVVPFKVIIKLIRYEAIKPTSSHGRSIASPSATERVLLAPIMIHLRGADLTKCRHPLEYPPLSLATPPRRTRHHQRPNLPRPCPCCHRDLRRSAVRSCSLLRRLC